MPGGSPSGAIRRRKSGGSWDAKIAAHALNKDLEKGGFLKKKFDKSPGRDYHTGMFAASQDQPGFGKNSGFVFNP
jgi:hypothetical protein